MQIHTLSKQDYNDLFKNIGLINLSTKALGLPNIFPFASPQNIGILFNEYSVRENCLIKYLKLPVLNNCNTIIWSEASQVGNKNYIYVEYNKLFKFQQNQTGYFKNVTEANFGSSIVIDFYSPFGINHTKQSRIDLNNLYQNNKIDYHKYFDCYVKSILNFSKIDIETSNHIIVAPIHTRDSILKYLRVVHGIAIPIKCYDIDERGAKKSFKMLQ